MDRMFQDAAGLIPAIEAGHPVGLVKRLAGTVDASQATALSRPTLGRWPKGPKPRNLLKGTAERSNPLFFPSTVSQGGVTATKSIVDGVLRYTFSGVATAAASVLLTSGAAASREYGRSLVGRTFRGSGRMRYVSDPSALPSNGLWLAISGRGNNGATWLEGPGIAVPSTQGAWHTINGTLTVSNAMVTGVSAGSTFQIVAGHDYTGFIVEVDYFQLEEGGGAATPYQPTDADGVPLAGYGQVRNLAPTTESLAAELWVMSAPSTKAGNTLHFEGATTIDPIANRLTCAIEVARSVGDQFTLSWQVPNADSWSDPTATLFLQLQGGLAVSGNLPVTIADAGKRVSVSGVAAASGGWVAALIATNKAVTLQNVRGIQLERGGVMTQYQAVIRPNNITEPGVEDVWFLVNDGNDALPATLPAGTYGIAWVNPAGGITFTTQTLAAAGPIDALRGTRMADVIIRQGDFTAAERALIEAEWSKVVA